MIEEDFGDEKGAPNIQYYQPALNALMEELSAEEIQHAKELAKLWNSEGSTDDAKARYEC